MSKMVYEPSSQTYCEHFLAISHSQFILFYHILGTINFIFLNYYLCSYLEIVIYSTSMLNCKSVIHKKYFCFIQWHASNY